MVLIVVMISACKVNKCRLYLVVVMLNCINSIRLGFAWGICLGFARVGKEAQPWVLPVAPHLVHSSHAPAVLLGSATPSRHDASSLEPTGLGLRTGSQTKPRLP